MLTSADAATLGTETDKVWLWLRLGYLCFSVYGAARCQIVAISGALICDPLRGSPEESASVSRFPVLPVPRIPLILLFCCRHRDTENEKTLLD